MKTKSQKNEELKKQALEKDFNWDIGKIYKFDYRSEYKGVSIDYIEGVDRGFYSPPRIDTYIVKVGDEIVYKAQNDNIISYVPGEWEDIIKEWCSP